MNPHPPLLAVLRADTTLRNTLRFLPDDARAEVVYAPPLTLALIPTAFLAAGGSDLASTPLPSVVLAWPGRPTIHPQNARVPSLGLVAMYCMVYAYAPDLPGVDGYGIVRTALDRCLALIGQSFRFTDPDSGHRARCTWFGGSVGPALSPEFATTIYAADRYQITFHSVLEE